MKLSTLLRALQFNVHTFFSFSVRLVSAFLFQGVTRYVTVWTVTNYADAYWFLYSNKTHLFNHQER